MMISRKLIAWAAILSVGAAAHGQLVVNYDPTTLDPSVETTVTISLTDTSGLGEELGFLALRFEPTDGLSLGSFAWLVEEFSDIARWFASVDLPAPQVVAFWADSISIAPDGTLLLATVTVTASAGASGTLQTLTVFPEGTDAVLGRPTGETIEIVTGASVTLTVTGTPVDGGGGDAGGGDAGGGGSGGGDAGTPPGQDGTTSDPDGNPGGSSGDGTGDTSGDGSGDTAPPGDSGGGGTSDGGSSDSSGSAGDGGVTGDGSVTGDGTDAEDDPTGFGTETDAGGSDEAGDAGGGGGMVPMCGVGMVVPLLFTLCCLSVMKPRGRSRRPRRV